MTEAAGGAGRAATPGPLRRDLLGTALAALAVALLIRGMVVEPFAVTGGSMAPTLLDGDVVLVSRLAYGLKFPFTGFTLLPLAAPRRGDVVVFRDPRDRSRRLVRRVIGLDGDVVELREQQLLVSGVLQPRLPAGERDDQERDPVTGVVQHDTCRAFREMLALGRLDRPGGEGPAPQAEAWSRGAAAGVMGHDLLQCRRARPGRGQGPFGPVRRGHLFLLGDNRDRAIDGRDGGWQVPVEDVVGRVALVGWWWGPGGWWPWAGAGQGVRLDRLLKPVE
jgi:signal peptidase I